MAPNGAQLYQSFLIRCWSTPQEGDDGVPEWRFELQVVAAEQEKHLFSSYELLMAFVAARLAAVAGNEGP